MKQVKDYMGKRVTVTLLDGTIVNGRLAFYHFDTSAIHLNAFLRKDRAGNVIDGDFIVINGTEWREFDTR